MKNLIYEILFLALSIPYSAAYTQGIEITNGGKIEATGAATIEINNGNFKNNGTYSKGTETFTMSGYMPDTISGSGGTNIHNLEILDTSGVTALLDTLRVQNLKIDQEGIFTINPDKLVTVNSDITNTSDVAGLIIKSDPDNILPSGSLIFHNSISSPINATVEMFSKASWDLNAVAGSKYKWQYIGIPILSLPVNLTMVGSYVREYNEAGNGSGFLSTNRWIQLQNGATMSSAKGYEIVQAAAKTYRFKGQLVNSDYTSGELSYTTSADYPGQHLIGNPYTAAINISKIVFGNDMLKTVYLYNTGSYNDWLNANLNPQDSTTTTLAGQFVTVPQELAGQGSIPAQIPAMQAFLVKVAKNSINSTVSIPYSSIGTVVKNKDMQRSKSNTTTHILQIDIKGSRFADRMWIAENPACSHQFDNGWDGEKFFGSTLAPQLFAMESDGNYQVNSVDDINNTELGFQAGEDTEYRMTFTYDNQSSADPQLYLIDMENNSVTDITQSGTTYSFTAVSTPSPVNRFKIVTSPGVTTDLNYDKVNQLNIFSTGNNVTIQNNDSYPGKLIIMNLSGKIIQEFNFNANNTTNLRLNLLSGAYIITGQTKDKKITRKIIL